MKKQRMSEFQNLKLTNQKMVKITGGSRDTDAKGRPASGVYGGRITFDID
ncbi:MAG: hypothetical protein AAFQ94_06655 [Bacteroidota bacterium]